MRGTIQRPSVAGRQALDLEMKKNRQKLENEQSQTKTATERR